MVKHQNESFVTSETQNGKLPKNLGSSKAVAIVFTALAIAAASVGVYQHAEDVQRRTVKFDTTLYADATSTSELYKKALEDNARYINNLDNRNALVSAQVVDYGTYTSTMVSNTDILNISEAPVMDALYVEEASTQTIINGIENLETKYAPYLYYYGKRNDLNANLFYVIEKECDKYGLDPYVMLGVIMTESGGNANAKSKQSTATGMCQILSGTGKYIYEDLMGHGKGTYSHSMAYNPELNIRMGIAYLGTLVRQTGSLHRAIRSYRGLEDRAYYNSINKYMAMSGGRLTL